VNSICSGITRQLYANVIARRSFRLVRTKGPRRGMRSRRSSGVPAAPRAGQRL